MTPKGCGKLLLTYAQFDAPLSDAHRNVNIDRFRPNLPLATGRFCPHATFSFAPSSLIASRSQIGELNFPDHAHVAVYLALDLILKHAAGLGQLTHHDEDLAAVDELGPLGSKCDLLTDREFMR
ncbi:MAG TPA: hypothetical protein VK657_13955 [Terriglobales bacterium]|nr:hypothetical protein [Terriglobales bacterium]